MKWKMGYWLWVIGLVACQTAVPVAPPTTQTVVSSQPLVTITPSPLPPFTPSPVHPVAQTTEGSTPLPSPATPPTYTYHIITTYPHDPTAFIQGLDFDDNGVLYEGTGLYGRSSLRRVDLETGEVEQQIDIAPDLFGEGITVWEDKIIQLTWQNHVGFVYNKESFDLLQQFSYTTEGWGITHDDEKLIVSDGTAYLYFWHPETLQEIGRVEVRDINGPVVRLNELEYVEGEVYANIWQTDRIARINPETGQVIGWIDLAGLLDPKTLTQPVDVLNGIVYDDTTNQLYVTGKLWPTLFEIELIPVPVENGE